MMPDLSPHEYRSLIRGTIPTTVDADTAAPNFEQLFTPNSHRLALDPDVTVVRGARGVGKTVWFKALQDDALRMVAVEAYQLSALNSIQSLSGYGSERKPEAYPGPAVLRKLLRNGVEPVDIWTAVLLKGLEDQNIARFGSWPERVDWVAASPEAVEQALSSADRHARDENKTILILFDALDRLHEDRRQADRLVEGILRLALDLRLSSRRLRAKVFIRPDMLENSSLQFADASKLVANTADLAWSETNLYGLFFHHLGNANGEESQRFRQSTSRTQWRTVGDGARHVPPEKVTSDRRNQQEIFTRIAGPYMGTNHRKGHTYPWLPNHLMDGAAQVSPRSFLSALAKAAEITGNSYGGHDRALHYDAIRAGVQAASRIRVGEIREDIPWVATAVMELAGLQVPMEREIIRDRWSSKTFWQQIGVGVEPDTEDGDETVHTGPEATDSDELIEELRELGVMSYRADGRVDVPDVYRIEFNIGRKGGVPRVSR